MDGKPRAVPLLDLIPAAQRAETVVERRYRAGDHIFQQGEATTGLWFVLDGRVAVERVGADGSLSTTGVWTAGDMVGIAGLWDRRGYPASARALSSPTVMGWLARDGVMRLHQEVPAFGLEVSRLLAERLRFVQESVAGRLGRPIVNQVAAVLCTLSDRMGPSVGLTHEDLAHIIGTHRETVTRALHELAQDGALHSRHGAVDVLDRQKLEEWRQAPER